MATTSIDVTINYNTPGPGEMPYWIGIQLRDEQLDTAVNELEAAIAKWIKKYAVNAKELA